MNKDQYDIFQFHSFIQRVFNDNVKKKQNQCDVHCPFCNHRKPKLGINLQNQVYHCWVCGEKGRGMWKIFKKLNTPPRLVDEYKQYFTTVKQEIKIQDEDFYMQMYKALYIDWQK